MTRRSRPRPANAPLLLVLLGASLALAAAPPVAAWSDPGHRVVAAIAWERLSPQAREAAVELLQAAPEDSGLRQRMPRRGSEEERRRQLFLAAATWPDDVRGTPYHHGGWHYVNEFWRRGADGRPVAVPELQPAPQNAVERLGALGRSLADAGEAPAQRALDLAWILHVVGDLHQPLHTSARVTERPDERRGDRGGNTFLLHRDRRGEPWNLHAYWDRVLPDAVPRRPAESEAAWIDRLVRDHVLPSLPPAVRTPLRPGDFEAWMREGVELAQTLVYDGVERDREPSEVYRREALRVSRERLALAGVRLAALLEVVLGGGAGEGAGRSSGRSPAPSPG